MFALLTTEPNLHLSHFFYNPLIFQEMCYIPNMNGNVQHTHKWQGKQLKVNVLFTRAGLAQQIWVENDSGAVLIDVGDGALRDILSNELELKELRGIFFTHGHFDHMGGRSDRRTAHLFAAGMRRGECGAHRFYLLLSGFDSLSDSCQALPATGSY